MHANQLEITLSPDKFASPSKRAETVGSRSRKKIKANEGNSSELDGYLFLKLSGCELPDEVIKVNITGYNLLSTNPNELSLFTNVSEVIADDNFLSLEQMAIFENLQRLSLMNNRIEYLEPRARLNLPKLEHLDLTLNKIKNLENLCALTGLKTLSLARNGLSAIPYDLVDLSQLQTLDLSFNNISEESALDMWAIFSMMPALRFLFLSNNKISTIQEPRSVMQQMKLLKLDLSSNLLTNQFDVACLINLGALNVLNLSGNHCVINREAIRKSFDLALGANVIFNLDKSKSTHNLKRSQHALHYSNIALEKVASDRPNLEGQRDLFGFAIGKEDFIKQTDESPNENSLQQANGKPALVRGFNIKSGFYGQHTPFKGKRVFMTEGPTTTTQTNSANLRRDIRKAAGAIVNKQLLLLTRQYLSGHLLEKKADTNSCFKFLTNYFAN